jgi:hypothetical protein
MFFLEKTADRGIRGRRDAAQAGFGAGNFFAYVVSELNLS